MGRGKPKSDSGKNQRIGIVLSYTYTVSAIVVQLIYVPLLLKGMGQSEYGLYQLVGSFAAWVMSMNTILSAGVTRYYCKYMAANDEDLMEATLGLSRRIYWLMSACAMMVMAVLAWLVPVFYSNALSGDQLYECSLMLVVLGVNIVVTMNNTVSMASITANERFIFLKGLQLAVTWLEPAIVVLLLGVWPNALMVTCVVTGMNIACSLIRRLYAKVILCVKMRYRGFNSLLFKGLLAFSGAVLLVTMADQVFWKTDQLIIGYFFGASEVAKYAVGAQIYTAYLMLGLAISSVFMPEISRLCAKTVDMHGLDALFVKVGRLSLYVLLAVLCAFAIFGKEFIVLWVGEDYLVAWYVAILVMIPFTIDLVQNLGLTILQVLDKYLFRGIMYLVLALMNVLATIPLVQSVGLVGAALSTGIAMFLGNGIIMNIYYSKKIGLDIKGYWRELAREALPLVVLALVAIPIWDCFRGGADWVILIIGIALFLFAYFCVAWICSMNQFEKGLIRGMFRR